MNIINRNVDQSPTNSSYLAKGMKHPYKDSSVNASFFLGVVPTIPERYANLRILFDRLKLEKLDCVSVCDIKLCQILVGLSPSSRAIYPCYICEWNRNDPFVVADLSTFENCHRNHDQFLASDGILSKAKYFKNCIHPVLVDGKEDDLIIDKMVLPELHLFEGAVNHIIENLEKKLVYRENA